MMEMLLILLLLALLVFIQWLIASYAASIAQDKGYSQRTWFHMCFWLGLPSLILVAAMPNLNLEKTQKEILELLRQNQQPSQPASAPAAPAAAQPQEPVRRRAAAPDSPREIMGNAGKQAVADRSGVMMECPCCGTKQRSDRSVCFRCGVSFADDPADVK